METTCSTDTDIEAVSEKQLSQDNKDYALSVLRPLHLIERFCQVIESGETPPQWMIDALHDGFACYLGCEGKKHMEAFFNITQSQFKEKHPDNIDEMMESYAMLQYLFDMLHPHAAKIIKTWYGYTHSTKTLTQDFQRTYSKSLYGDCWRSRLNEEMKKTERENIFLEKMKVEHPPVFKSLKDYMRRYKPDREYPTFK